MELEHGVRRIDPEAYYSELDLILRWGLGLKTQSKERQAGRLKAIESNGDIVYRGADLLAWLDPKKQGAPESSPAKSTGRHIPTRGELSQIEPGRIYSGGEILKILGLDSVDQNDGRKNGSLRCADPGDGRPYSAQYVGADVLAWVNNLSNAPPAIAAAISAAPPLPELRSALPTIPPREAARAVSVSPLQGTKPMAKQTTAADTFNLMVEQKMNQGMSRNKAMSAVVAAHPDLHEAYLAEANNGNGRVHCLPPSAPRR